MTPADIALRLIEYSLALGRLASAYANSNVVALPQLCRF